MSLGQQEMGQMQQHPLPVKIATEVQKAEPIPVQNMITGTLKELLIRFIFEQGPTVTILISILGAMIYYSPLLLTQIQTGYTQNSINLEKTLKIYIDAKEREMKLILDSHDRDRESFEKAMRKL